MRGRVLSHYFGGGVARVDVQARLRTARTYCIIAVGTCARAPRVVLVCTSGFKLDIQPRGVLGAQRMHACSRRASAQGSWRFDEEK